MAGKCEAVIATSRFILPFFFAGMGGAEAASETFNTALPVAEGDFVFRQQAFFSQASNDPSTARRSMEAGGGVSVLGWGESPDLTFFVMLPVIEKRLDMTGMSGQRIGQSTRGISDLSLLGRYTIFQDDVPGRSFRMAPFVGTTMPSGESRAGDSFGRLPAMAQLGTGSWNPLGGVVATLQTLDYEIDTQASYQANTEANDFRFGDMARLDGSVQYRLYPRALGSGVPGFFYGVLEANLIHQGSNQASGASDPNSGGTRLFLDPGIQYVTERWVLEAIILLPVVQDLNGLALKQDYTVLSGFRANF